MRRWIYTQIERLRFKRGVAQGHVSVTQFQHFGTLITFERIELSPSNFGTDMEDGP